MIKLFQQVFKKKSIRGAIKNPLFYSIITILIFAIHLLHTSLHFSHDLGTFIGLSFCLFAESMIEGAVLCAVGTIVFPKKYLRYPFVVFAAFLPILHLVDFILERLFSLSIWHSIYSVFSQSFDNFIELLYATNIPLWTWAFGFLGLFVLGFLFIFLHERTHRVKNEFYFAINPIYFFALIGLVSLGYLPLKNQLFQKASVFNHAANVLPFKDRFTKLAKSKNFIKLQNPCFDNQLSVVCDNNIYIFIIESLRNDAINPETAPCLTQLGQDFFRHNFCIAGANGTHLSWYSLFFSQPAVMWKKTGNIGSPFLKELKKAGYSVHVLSSARLSYYDMDKQIFGQNSEAIDDYFCPKLTADMSAYDADKQCFEQLKSLNNHTSSKKAFIVFLDATHFGYSLPEDAELKFLPCVDSIPFMSTVFSRVDVTGIKNRYFNAIFTLDKLFQDFVSDLKTKQLFDKSLMMVTADHGEEFYEKGQLFHASHLSDEQLFIPFILKTPHDYPKELKDENTFSHKDMFPLIKAILTKKAFSFQNYQLASRFNFSLPPEETVMISRESKSLYKYDKQKHALQCLKIYSPNRVAEKTLIRKHNFEPKEDLK